MQVYCARCWVFLKVNFRFVMKVLFTFSHLSSPNSMENDHNFLFFDYEIWTELSNTLTSLSQVCQNSFLKIFAMGKDQNLLFWHSQCRVHSGSENSQSRKICMKYAFCTMCSRFKLNQFCQEKYIPLGPKCNFTPYNKGQIVNSYF